MKAIVLSYDKYHPLVDHMIKSYEEEWPSHPFVFRIPYQNFPELLKEKYNDKVELIQTPQAIKPTVLTLLSDLQDDEWIYWCIDDKYLVAIDQKAADNCYKWLNQNKDPNLQGLLLCRCRRLLNESNLRANTEIKIQTGETLIERLNYYQIWLHQFMKVGILRKLFNEFPDEHFKAIEMDAYTGQREELPVKKFEDEEQMYVVVNNIVRFGESTTGGNMTRNCRDSFLRKGLEIPPTFQISPEKMYMGKLSLKYTLQYFLKKIAK